VALLRLLVVLAHALQARMTGRIAAR